MMTRTKRAAKAAVAEICHSTTETTDRQAEQLREVAILLTKAADKLHDPHRPYPSRPKPKQGYERHDPDSEGSWDNVVKAYEDREP
jgi:hypothetical protein